MSHLDSRNQERAAYAQMKKLTQRSALKIRNNNNREKKVNNKTQLLSTAEVHVTAEELQTRIGHL
jgi:hypothetical protein